MSDASILDPQVRAALDALGEPYETLACEAHLADTAEFCAHYGISPSEACNTIIVALKTNPRGYIACLVRADTRLDVNHKVRAVTGVKRLSFATPEETLELTGQSIGGVAILGLPASIPIVIDTRVMEQPRVIVGGGNRTSKVRIAPQSLARLPNARVEDVGVVGG